MYKKIYGKTIEKQKLGSWRRILSFADCGIKTVHPSELLSGYEHIFKQDSGGLIGLKSLDIGTDKVRLVIKVRRRKDGLRHFFRRLWHSRAVCNFRTAYLLASKKIPVVIPVMAAVRRKNFSLLDDVLVSRYIENSMSLYDILFGRDGYAIKHWAQVKKQIIRQIAIIFADMHKAGLWHRDSKAGNFLICGAEDNSYTVKLIDLDGIKRYGFGKACRKMQPLWDLAETVSRFRMASITDLWRGFNIYCDNTGIEKKKRRRLFYKLEKKVVAKRLLVEARDAYKKI